MAINKHVMQRFNSVIVLVSASGAFALIVKVLMFINSAPGG